MVREGIHGRTRTTEVIGTGGLPVAIVVLGDSERSERENSNEELHDDNDRALLLAADLTGLEFVSVGSTS